MSDRAPQFALIDAFVSRESQGEEVDVLVVPKVDRRMEVKLAERTPNRRVPIVDNEHELLNRCEQLEKKLKYLKPRKMFADFLSSSVSLVYGPDGVPGSFRLGVFDWMASSEEPLPTLMVVRRNQARGETLCRFLAAFRKVPPSLRPKIVLDAEDSFTAARHLLRHARDNIAMFVPGAGRLERGLIEPAEITLERFPEALLSGAFSACAEMPIDEPSASAPIEEKRRFAVLLYQRIQSNKGCDRRFEAADDVVRLEAFLRLALDEAGDRDRAWLSEALAFALLDRSYVLEEGRAPIEHALHIAQALGDEELVAWVQRHANIAAGVTPFASELLQRSTEVLQRAGRFAQAAYAATNLTITDLHRVDRPIDLPRAEAVVDYVLDWAPYCDRLGSIINAAGAAALLAGNYGRAAELFEHAAKSNGGRLHRVSAQVNLLIAQHVDGTRHSADAVERLFRSIVISGMSKKLNYHHVYLLANLVPLTRSKALKARIRAHLTDARYMDYEDDVVRDDRLLAFLASRFTMIADGRSFRGHRGRFVETYNLLPLAQFIWN
ncbi:MAG TPA: hypothetical protein VEZ20_03370 [Allosphingosinicella sp.]|jgi:hypothetical protein|nr:hypothetical protein [Allosphingosinicella sp.]